MRWAECGAALLTLLAACVPTYGDGDFLCTDTEPLCPDGYNCDGTRCRLGAADAAMDVAADIGTDVSPDTNPPDGDPPTDSRVDTGPACPFPTLFESASGRGGLGSLSFQSDMWFWRFLSEPGFCVSELGIGLVEHAAGGTITVALFELSSETEIPARFSGPGPDFMTSSDLGRIVSPTEVSVAIEETHCLSSTPQWWAVAAWSQDPSTVPSLGHSRSIDSMDQRAYRGGDGAEEVVGGARLFVRGCVP